MRNKALYFITLASLAATAPVILPTPADAQAATQHSEAQLRSLVSGLHPQHGQVSLHRAGATLDLGNDYDFYGPDDARKILVDIWGNPASAADGILGIVMPAGASPLSDAWGAVVTYESTGYVSDSDARTADYDALLQQLREGEQEANSERRTNGYPAMTLVGWAQRPNYDAANHSVIWARNLAVEGQTTNSLNYDLRMLGRRGVMSVNFISGMPQLESIRSAATAFAGHARFNPGATYADYDSNTDAAAGYGIAGLVAAGVGIGAAQKLGLLAILLKFGKFIIIGAIALFAGLRNRIMGLFRRGDTG